MCDFVPSDLIQWIQRFNRCNNCSDREQTAKYIIGLLNPNFVKIFLVHHCHNPFVFTATLETLCVISRWYFKEPSERIIRLEGRSGTGKTTLFKFLASLFPVKQKSYVLEIPPTVSSLNVNANTQRVFIVAPNAPPTNELLPKLSGSIDMQPKNGKKTRLNWDKIHALVDYSETKCTYSHGRVSLPNHIKTIWFCNPVKSPDPWLFKKLLEDKDAILCALEALRAVLV